MCECPHPITSKQRFFHQNSSVLLWFLAKSFIFNQSTSWFNSASCITIASATINIRPTQFICCPLNESSSIRNKKKNKRALYWLVSRIDKTATTSAYWLRRQPRQCSCVRRRLFAPKSPSNMYNILYNMHYRYPFIYVL